MTRARIIPERLVERIAAAGLSYSAVARMLGVKQPTISRLATGEQGSTARIDQLARIVASTPAYLTGEVDDPFLDSPVAPELTPEQQEWLELFDALDTRSRASLLQIARTLVRGLQMPTINSPKPAYRGEPTSA